MTVHLTIIWYGIAFGDVIDRISSALNRSKGTLGTCTLRLGGGIPETSDGGVVPLAVHTTTGWQDDVLAALAGIGCAMDGADIEIIASGV